MYNDQRNISSDDKLGADYSYPNQPYALTTITIPDADTTLTNVPYDQLRETQDIKYNFNGKVLKISDTSTIDKSHYKIAEFTYGCDNERATMKYSDENGLIYTRYYFPSYEVTVCPDQTTRDIAYISSPSGLLAMQTIERGATTADLHYVFTDHLGSITAVDAGAFTYSSYDAWGNRRSAVDWHIFSASELLTLASTSSATALLTDRGYTGHEHLDQFQLINMNGRLYDPINHRFLSPDNYIQSPENTQSLNRYSYCMNNPLKYTDPSGNSCGSFFYEFQKTFSPVAVNISLPFGTHQDGIGFDISIGLPKICLFSYRFNYGATYYFKNDVEKSGWETRKGGQVSYLDLFTIENTTFTTSEHSQTVSQMSFGNAFGGVDYSNDADEYNIIKIASLGLLKNSDGQDRWRTAAFSAHFMVSSIGVNMETGDGGPDRYHHYYYDKNGYKTYNADDGYNPDDRRMGALYFDTGGFKIGWDSESIRNLFQNKIAHDALSHGQNNPEGPFHFKVLDIPGLLYWNTSTGGGLW